MNSVLNLNKYEPNFSNKRVVDRIATVLDWCDLHVDSKSPTQLHNSKLTKVFGNQAKELSNYLRSNLLIQSGNYTVGKSSLSYTLNQDGYDKLSQKIGRRVNHIECNKAVLQTAEDLYPELLTLEFEYTDKSHRLWHPLQQMKSSKKAQFWNNYLPFNYDVDASAPTILLQLATKHGLLPLLAGPIQDYLDNKDEFRQYVATLANTDVKTAKRIINSLFNGARLAANGFCSTFGLLDFRKDSMKALQEDQRVISLRSAIKQMWNKISSKFTTKTSKDKWSVYFQHERKVLDAVKFFLDEKGVQYFTEHDGFRSSEKIDVNELSEYVYNRTSIKVNFSEDMEEKKEEVIITAHNIANDLPFHEEHEKMSITDALNKRRYTKNLSAYGLP